MKRAGKKPIKMIAAISVASFSLVAAVVSTVAWFIAVNTVKTSNIEMVVDDPSDCISEISFHKYYGLSTDKYYLFNPNPEAKLLINDKTITLDADPGFQGITLDTYTASDHHHPLLMLCKLKKPSLSLYAITDHPFLAEFKPTSGTTVATYAALTYVNTVDFVGGETYFVTSDNVNGGLEGSTYASTAYRWNGTSKKWELIWVDLAAARNPLSSVIESYFFYFNFATPQDGATTSHTYNSSNPSSLAIAQSSCTSANEASFAKFRNGTFTEFSKTVTFFQGTVSNDTVYLGIMIDYSTLALEYISSYYLGDPRVTAGLNFVCDWKIGV